MTSELRCAIDYNCFIFLNIMEEIWKKIDGAKENYEVSNLGNIRSTDYYRVRSKTTKAFHKGHMIKPNISNTGYLRVCLMAQINKKKNFSIHRLVAMTFLENPHNLPLVNHKDGNKLNNYVGNLEFVTASENVKHSYINKLSLSGENHPYAKLTNNQVLEIRNKLQQGHRGCDLAIEYNVTRTCVSGIKNKNLYKHV